MLFTFDKSYNYVHALFFRSESPWSHFDWMIGFTLQYTFKEKS